MMSTKDLTDNIVSVRTQAEADALLEQYIADFVTMGRKRRAAKKLAKANIGYYAGYADEATARRIWRLFRTRHPIFGRSFPTATEAFNLGKKWGAKSRS